MKKKLLVTRHISANVPHDLYDRFVEFSKQGQRTGNKSAAIIELLEIALPKKDKAKVSKILKGK